MIDASSYDHEIAAITLWGEARSEEKLGQIAVVWTMINRCYGNPGRFGKTIAEVCKKPWQFSCWNKSDPQYEAMCAREANFDDYPGLHEQLLIVAEVFDGLHPDPTGGATHYLNPRAVTAGQRKRSGMLPGKQFCAIGSHHFYRPQDLTPPERRLGAVPKPVPPLPIDYLPNPEPAPAREGWFRRLIRRVFGG